MIVTKTPFRLTLGGGGTDLPSFYSKYGGFVLTSSIDRAVYVIIKRMFEEKIRVSYSITEIEDSVESIRHPLVREALKLLNLQKNIEIVTIADVPSKTGLGSSGSFTVGLLNALHTFKGELSSNEHLAEEACHVQMDILKEPEGKQDPYIAAMGGIISLDISKNGTVDVQKIALANGVMSELQNSLLFFYTGIQRSSSSILAPQRTALEKNESDVVEPLIKIKEIGYRVKEALLKGNLEEFGRLQHEHWLTKKRITNNMSNAMIDRWYDSGIKAGALGGKIMGAGGGGFLMFCSIDSRDSVRRVMAKEGLQEINFRLGAEGSKVILNI
jgi:D-glycero-alpha-D-manno-heptose-7-phosphate kinase